MATEDQVGRAPEKGRSQIATCPVCASWDREIFYRVENVPVECATVYPSAAEAKSVSLGDLELVVCRRCGFIANDLFDPALQPPADLYEGSQEYSRRFSAFADAEARFLVEECGVRRKRVLEVGCGKGEFLVRLCELGENDGIGFDPVVDAASREAAAARGVHLHSSLFPGSHAGVRADVVVCRHTLEHIPAVSAFLRSLVENVSHGPQGTYVIEVPDAERIVREAAFWDVYYEHCSYFTEASLDRALEAAGLRPVEIRREFDGQYLIAIARAESGGANVSARPANSDLLALAESFDKRAREKADLWRRKVARTRSSGRDVVLWGSGSKAAGFLAGTGVAPYVGGIVDVNPRRQGRFQPGHGLPIVAPQALQELRPGLVIIMNEAYVEEISSAVRELGIDAELRAAASIGSEA